MYSPLKGKLHDAGETEWDVHQDDVYTLRCKQALVHSAWS